ncbi:hypothetical protein BO94DRAFT_551053 [Aspergillus sclerotioniger CBS 115572]|uniref:Uncharacterized protein n=1 Tax=Aspergillus sclerotioniger CBS 115572 TaxID=1450535 RepID=A0A317V685_9EURO|nr:hypothetical protein BO94DRAFT_551053 [Aspergillus sclerotioniger CBS 115572]PWY68558.1 hypothetical protein BO94DRAFT_551053 [Aspergillus sclerotioniger CBS 115572]
MTLTDGARPPHERKSDETQSGQAAWDWRAVNKEGGGGPVVTRSQDGGRWTIDSGLALVRNNPDDIRPTRNRQVGSFLLFDGATGGQWRVCSRVGTIITNMNHHLDSSLTPTQNGLTACDNDVSLIPSAEPGRLCVMCLCLSVSVDDPAWPELVSSKSLESPLAFPFGSARGSKIGRNMPMIAGHSDSVVCFFLVLLLVSASRSRVKPPTAVVVARRRATEKSRIVEKRERERIRKINEGHHPHAAKKSPFTRDMGNSEEKGKISLREAYRVRTDDGRRPQDFRFMEEAMRPVKQDQGQRTFDQVATAPGQD